MRVFSDASYSLRGRQYVDGRNRWVLCDTTSATTSESLYVIVDCAKYIHDGKVYFLMPDGSVEHKHQTVAHFDSMVEPALAFV